MQKLKAILILLLLVVGKAFADGTTRVLYVGLPGQTEMYEKPSFKWGVESYPLRSGTAVTVIPADVAAPFDTFETDDNIKLPGKWLLVYTSEDTGFVFDALFLPFRMEQYSDVFKNKHDYCEPEELPFFEHIFGMGDTALIDVKPFGSAVEYFKTKKANTKYCVQQFTRQLGMGFTFTYSRPSDYEYAPVFYLESTNISLPQMYFIATMFNIGQTSRGYSLFGTNIYSDYFGERDCYSSKIYQKGNKITWAFSYFCE
jgi:hypothetical protein